MLKLIKFYILIVMMVLLTACGGGGGSPSDPQQAAINKIAAYADNGEIKPTLLDYAEAGVTGVTQENVAQVNQAVEALSKEAVDTAEEIQTIADEYGIVLPLDITPPVVTVLGQDPALITVNRTYLDAGASAVDDTDGTVTVVTTGSVDTATLGMYELTYTATDSAGNTATKTRTVEVLPLDTAAPVITISGENPATVFLGNSYTDAGATATDDRDGTVSVVSTGNVDTTTIGTYIIAYDAEDVAGNHAQTQIRTVNVVLGPDTTAPVIIVLGDNPVNIDQNSIYTDAGATVSDDRDDNVTIVTTGTVNTAILGTYVVAYTSADNAGNSATVTRTVHVLPPDTIPPVITLTGESTVTIDVNETYVDAGATAVDERDGVVSVTTTGNVDTSAEGTYIITYTAKDAADNNSTETRSVNVIEAVNLAPAANAGMDIVTKEGETFLLDGTASNDDNEIVQYEWFKNSVKFADGNSLELNASDFGKGKYVITLRVEDGEGLSDTDTVRLHVLQSIKRTGQYKSYNEDGVEIEDGSLKDDGYYQKGVSARYTRDDDNGTVTDHITGLMWQDNARVTKVWLEGEKYDECRNDTGSPACFDTSGDTAVSYCADQNLSGYEDWRLPDIKELQRIVNYDNDNPAFDSVFLQANVGFYWAVTPVVNYQEYGWVVNFEYGDANGYLKGAQLSVRCVRDRNINDRY